MSLVQQIRDKSAKAIETIYGAIVGADQITINQTKPEFEGDYTVVLFSLVKQLKKSPDQLGKEIGEFLVSNHDLFTGFNVIKGFLNLEIRDGFYTSFLTGTYSKEKPFSFPAQNRNVIVEYASPNTNKPLHLGHLRNIFLGWSVSEILKATGNQVYKTCIVNDRGIHICKSMIAWELFGNGETPESTQTKGDHFVGNYYVKCETQIKEEESTLSAQVKEGNLENINPKDRQRLIEIGELMNAISGNGAKDKEKYDKLADDRKELIRASTPIMQKAQQMLLDWEQGKPEVLELWKKMNGWVYAGFDETYKRIGTDFDKIYYESETYIQGKQFVEEGLRSGLFYRKDDGSVWIDLTSEGLDEKLVLRKDGTSVYITQDLGLADEKFRDFNYDKSFYVIADEQIYHMKVLELILKKLGKPYADGISHLSYGMVELPSGKMKSREGTVVDADDMVNLMVLQAEQETQKRGKIEGLDPAELKDLYETLALGGLKFFLLKVDPRKRMVFNPEESISLQGFTGPYIQYTHARIRSILRKAAAEQIEWDHGSTQPKEALFPLEKEMLVLLEQFGEIIKQAAAEHNPAAIANHIYYIAQTYNSFNDAHRVIKAESEEKRLLRLQICQLTASIIKDGMGLLGIRVPERM